MEHIEHIIPLHSDFSVSGFQPYVLDLSSAGLAEEEDVFTLVFVVMKRNQGLLAALPMHGLSDEVLQSGTVADRTDLVGPHLNTKVDAALMSEEAPASDPLALDGQSVDVLLVDFSSDIAVYMKALTAPSQLQGILLLDPSEIGFIPSPSSLSSIAIAWTMDVAQSAPERMQFYSADEVPETPHPGTEEALPEADSPVEQQPPGRRRAPGGVTGKGSPQSSARKKPTVATLADSLEKLSQALPAITTQLQDLSSRTAAIEANVANPPDKSSILRQPLSSSALVGSSNVVGPQALVKEMPPPRSLSTPAKVVPKNLFTEKETKEMAMDFPESPALAQAVLEQSRALTALVAQMANGDHSLELPSGSGLSSRGSIGREKLRNELAQHKGTFFTNVIQNMSRRMHPTMSAEVDAAALIQRGVTPPLYLERFGGYGRTRDLGFIIWQVSIAMAYMQQENFPAAMDSLALLFVCLEQSAMDNGRMDLGLTLALVEDPPHSLFSARSIAASVNPRPFAPTAGQRWATVALQYLKESDTIATRRQEVASAKAPATPSPQTPATTNPKPKPKRKAWAKAKQTGQQQEQEEE